MTGRTAGRVGLVALAAVAVVWFAYDLRALSLDAQGQAEARVAHRVPQVARALSLFAQAARGNADPTPRIDEARFLLSLHRTSQAADTLSAVVRTNSGNVVAWSLLAAATAGSDLSREAEANRHLFLLFGHPVAYYAAQGVIFSPTGLVSVVPGHVQGHVDGVQVIGRVARFVGWSATVTKTPKVGFSVAPSSDVMILANGRFVAGGTPTIARSDVARFYHVPAARVGFTVDVPVAQLETAGREDRVEVFGSSQGVASRLSISCGSRSTFGCSS